MARSNKAAGRRGSLARRPRPARWWWPTSPRLAGVLRPAGPAGVRAVHACMRATSTPRADRAGRLVKSDRGLQVRKVDGDPRRTEPGDAAAAAATSAAAATVCGSLSADMPGVYGLQSSRDRSTHAWKRIGAARALFIFQKFYNFLKISRHI